MGGGVPKGPSPIKTAEAQTGSNIGTAVANQVMGHTNQYTPYGNQTWTQSGTYTYNDPLTGKTYQLPQWDMTQTLSPDQQALQDEQTRAGTNTARLAADQSARLGGILGKPMDFSGAPGVDAPTFQRMGAGPKLATSYGDAGGYEAGRKAVEDALMARLNPSLNQDKARLETQLSNQGLKRGTEAWNSAMQEFGQQSNDARYGAILNAGEEQSRLAGLDQAKATFGNAALQQAFENRMGVAGFNNSAGQQAFQNQQGLRSQYLNEMYAARNQPINEIAALLGTGGVQQPQFMGPGSGGIANTDFAGIQNAYQNRQIARAQQGGMTPMGGLFGLANTAIGAFPFGGA